MGDAKEVATPLATGHSLSVHDKQSPTNATEFRSLIGALQYLNITRPDLGFAVNKLSQFMHKPTTTHWTAAKRLLRYLKGTLFHGLHLRCDTRPMLHAYTDADWAGNIDDRTSTSGFVIYIGANPISWSSRKQQSVAWSSTEAEYRAIAMASAELIWVKSLLQELGIHMDTAPSLYCDNIGATYVCANPIFHSRMKHIEIDYHFVRELVKASKMRVSHISTHDQLADILTKPLSRLRTIQLRDKMDVSDGTSILRGRVKI
ncbi:hypothetical protein ACJRO7_023338 [Eucalyptus globulus]|uniref:Uncharacterized protein n=1 Tax=Eucalyptus globulus TaxID=34317 RepID=A0ABD3K899_EUCGL